MLKTIGLAAAVSAFALSVPALAADPTAAMTDTSPNFWMVLDLSASGWWQDSDGTYYNGSDQYWNEEEDGYWYGFEGSAAFVISPAMSAQLDLWAGKYEGSYSGYDSFDGYYSGDSAGSSVGTEGHLTWEGADHRLGTFGGMSFYDDGDAFGFAGIEGAFFHGNWRLVGQVGTDFGIGGGADYYDHVGWWAGSELTYYHNPNLAFRGWAGVYGSQNDYEDTEYDQVRWGLMVEHKTESLPFSVYASYEGESWNGSDNDPEEWSGTEHEVYVGIRIFLNDATIQDVDRHVWSAARF